LNGNGILLRHARTCCGHPRLQFDANQKTWMAGTIKLSEILRRLSARRAGSANRSANELGAAAAAGINGVFHFGGDRATAVIGHPSCANGAGHHQRG
jgi:hypothetical protein